MSKKAALAKRAAPAKKAAAPAKKAAPDKRSGRYLTAEKATACFDGAGDLNPTKTKVGQPKKR